MSWSAKRVLTDETRESIIASNTTPQSTPIDIASQLRALGSRVRKSVTEGYITPSTPFVKSSSTGNIFRSANDTLREIYPPMFTNISAVSPRKRARSQSEYDDDSDRNPTEEDQTVHDTNMEGSFTPFEHNVVSLDRPVKALRKARTAMLSTRSLPDGLLKFTDTNTDAMMKSLEEEDWSVPKDDESFPSAYEPMILL